MKIKDYVRTKKGEIGKITYISKYNTAITTDYTTNPTIAKCVSISNIIKSSPNIIDLIEVGDYVNGLLIKSIGDKFYNCGHTLVYFKNIKSIVTKEQFESMKYKVGE